MVLLAYIVFQDYWDQGKTNWGLDSVMSSARTWPSSETSLPIGAGPGCSKGVRWVIGAGSLPNLMSICLQRSHMQCAGHHNPCFLEGVSRPGVLGICSAIRRLPTPHPHEALCSHERPKQTNKAKLGSRESSRQSS